MRAALVARVLISGVLGAVLGNALFAWRAGPLAPVILAVTLLMMTPLALVAVAAALLFPASLLRRPAVWSVATAAAIIAGWAILDHAFQNRATIERLALVAACVGSAAAVFLIGGRFTTPRSS